MVDLRGEEFGLAEYLLTLRILTLAFVCRNLLVACWDSLIDSLADKPTLSPILLRNFRQVVRKW